MSHQILVQRTLYCLAVAIVLQIQMVFVFVLIILLHFTSTEQQRMNVSFSRALYHTIRRSGEGKKRMSPFYQFNVAMK